MVPIISIVLIYASISAFILFQSNTKDVSDGVVASSVSLQCIYIYMGVREIFVTLYDCIRGRIFDY